MKITKTDSGFGVAASEDELRMMSNAFTEFRATPEEKGLARKMTQQLIAALPEPQGMAEADDDDDLFENPPEGTEDDDDI